MTDPKLPPLPGYLLALLDECGALSPLNDAGDDAADQIQAYARAALAPVVARAEKAEAELAALKEAVRGYKAKILLRTEVLRGIDQKGLAAPIVALETIADELAALNITKEQP